MKKDTFTIRILKSIASTLGILALSVCGLYTLIGAFFGQMSVEQGNTWILICMGIGIIFTIFFCTYMILEELKNRS